MSEDYNAELHECQDKIRVQRQRAYDPKGEGAHIEWDEEERLWLAAVEYKLGRMRLHCKSRDKAMDDCVDICNFIGLLFHHNWKMGHRPTESADLPDPAAQSPLTAAPGGRDQ